MTDAQDEDFDGHPHARTHAAAHLAGADAEPTPLEPPVPLLERLAITAAGSATVFTAGKTWMTGSRSKTLTVKGYVLSDMEQRGDFGRR